MGCLLKKLCTEFNRRQLAYCVAGGFAASLWGPPRGTEDIDMLVMIADEDRERFGKFLAARFHLLQSHDQEMVFSGIAIWRHIIQFGKQQSLFPLDLIMAKNDFLIHALSRRIELSYQGTTIPVISLEDLIILKLISFRDIDKYDIENLLKSEKPVDWPYLDKQIHKLRLNKAFIRQFRNNKL